MGLPLRPFESSSPKTPLVLSEVARVASLRAFKPIFPSSPSLMSRLWLLVVRVVRFGGLWVPIRAI